MVYFIILYSKSYIVHHNVYFLVLCTLYKRSVRKTTDLLRFVLFYGVSVDFTD